MIGLVAGVIFCSVIDDLGNKITLNRPAQRIVSLAPDVTEILYAAGAGPRLVGVISGSDYPAAAQYLPKVGSYVGIDLEKILFLKPDLIVTWGKVFSRQTDLLKQLDIPLYAVQTRQLEDIPRTIKNLGCLAGSDKLATDAADHFSHQLLQLKKKYQIKKPVKVFYQIGAYSLLTINKTSWINQVITFCGGRNVFANIKTISAEVNWESVIMENPEVVISDATNRHWKARWQQWPQIAAVKEKRLFNINPDVIERAGPRLLLGALELCRDLELARRG